MGLFSGILGGGSSKPSTTTQNYTPNVPQWIMDAYKTNTQKGIGLSNQPFNYTSSDVVEPFSQDQLSAFNQVRGNYGQYQNVYDNALGSLGNIQQQALNGPTNSQIQNLMNPYTQNVIDATRTGATRQADIERNQINQSSINAGAFGGSRQAVQNRELNQDLQTQLNNIQYTGLADSFNNAQGQFRQGLTQGAGAASQAVNTATAANGYNNTDINNLMNIGGQQQALGQQAKNFDFYKGYTQPMEATNYAQSLLGNIPLGMFGATTTNSSSQPNGGSGLGSLLGLAGTTAALGLPSGGTIGGSIFEKLGGLFGSGGATSVGNGLAGTGGGGSLSGFDTGLTSSFGFNNGGLVKGYASGGRVKSNAENSLEELLRIKQSLDMKSPEESQGKEKNAAGSGIGSILGMIAGNMIAPGIGGPIGSAIGGQIGGNFAEGGLVSDENAMGLTVPGMNVPNPATKPKQFDALSSILSPKQKMIFGSNDKGFQQQQQPAQGNAMNNVMPPPAAQQPQPQQMTQPRNATTSSASPLDVVKSTAGQPSSLVKGDEVSMRNENDPLNRIIKNTNMPLLTAGLALLGSDDPTFVQALGHAGLAGVKVALEQQKTEVDDEQKKAELAAKYLDLKQQAEKTVGIESSKAAARDITMRGQDLNRQSAAERNKIYDKKTSAIQQSSPTKLLTQATKAVDDRIANDLRLQTKVSKDPSMRQQLIDDQFKEFMNAGEKASQVQNELGEKIGELQNVQEGEAASAAMSGEEYSNTRTADTIASEYKSGKITREQAAKELKALGYED